MKKDLKQKTPAYFLLLIILLISLILALVFGSFPVLNEFGFKKLSDTQLKILLELRLPRVLCSAIAGALLACCGVISQGLLRNPLACPYTLGIAQLISLILFCFMFLPAGSAILLLTILIAALFAIALKLSRISFHNHSFSLHLILFGLALGTFCSSLILALQYSLDGISLLLITRWLMGSMAVVGYFPVFILSLILVIFLPVSLHKSRELDLLAFGDEFALSKGVPVVSLNLNLTAWLFITVTVIVWLIGPISFVGLIVPHIARLLGFVGHRSLLIVSTLIGAIFLVACDVLSRVVLSPMELPIGIITGLLGAPVFITLLINNLGREIK